MKGYEFKFTPGAIDGFTTEPFQKKGDKDAMAGKTASVAMSRSPQPFAPFPVAGKVKKKKS